MNATNPQKSLWIAFVVIVPALAAEDVPAGRPGQGLSFLPGDFAEYTNTLFIGNEKTALASTIMVAIGKVDERERVHLLTVKDGKLISRKVIYFDLTQAKVEQGELLETGQETLTINGKMFECTWEKRRNQNVMGTFWRSPDLPFEKYAKVQMEANGGRKMITELVTFGPDVANKAKNQEFLKRLQELNSQAPVNNSKP